MSVLNSPHRLTWVIAQVDMGLNFSLSLNFLHVEEPLCSNIEAFIDKMFFLINDWAMPCFIQCIVEVHSPISKQALVFMCLQNKPFGKMLEKKLLITSNFTFSQSIFDPFVELSTFFIKFNIVVSKLFRYGRV